MGVMGAPVLQLFRSGLGSQHVHPKYALQNYVLVVALSEQIQLTKAHQ
jgi:hypothetical protein